MHCTNITVTKVAAIIFTEALLEQTLLGQTLLQTKILITKNVAIRRLYRALDQM